MPLPINSTLSLLGASRPGDALPSKPKKAMLVRMSSEILDALEATAQPLVQFEFGENPVCLP
jgi:RNA polymerase II elongation factor ELL